MKKDVIPDSEFSIALVNGNSMHPLLKNRDKVFYTKNVNRSNFKKFDILLIKLENKVVCHYFWKYHKNFESSKGRFIQTRPLNPIWAFDLPVLESEVLGVVLKSKISFLLKIRILILSLFMS